MSIMVSAGNNVRNFELIPAVSVQPVRYSNPNAMQLQSVPGTDSFYMVFSLDAYNPNNIAVHRNFNVWVKYYYGWTNKYSDQVVATETPSADIPALTTKNITWGTTGTIKLSMTNLITIHAIWVVDDMGVVSPQWSINDEN